VSQFQDSRPIDPPTYTVEKFCEAHNISRAFFYQLVKQDQGPDILKVGRRTLIAGEAAAAWRRRLQSRPVNPN